MTTQTLKPSALTGITSGIAAESIATGNNASLSDTIDNRTTRYGFLSAELLYQFGTNPTAAKAIDIYLEKCLDGTSFEDALVPSAWLFRISPAADTSAHRVVLPLVAANAAQYRYRIVNVDTGQSVTVTLLVYGWNEVAES